MNLASLHGLVQPHTEGISRNGYVTGRERCDHSRFQALTQEDLEELERMFYYLAFATEKETKSGICSYSLKHYAERFPDDNYVCNGIAILGSRMVGL